MEDDDAMEIQLLLTEPVNEENLGKCLGGIFSENNTHQMGYELDSLTGGGAAAVEHTLTDHEMDDYLEPSMLGSFLSPWRRSRRGTYMRSKSWGVEVNHLFGSQSPSTNGGGKCRTRKNNDHWTEDEMIELVKGVSKEGIGKWSKVKGDHFATSIRTPVHLKDKWRNLVRACRATVTSKKKVIKVQKATESVVQRFRHQILEIATQHDDHKK